MKYYRRKTMFQTLVVRCVLLACLFVPACTDKDVVDPNENVEPEKVAYPALPVSQHGQQAGYRDAINGRNLNPRKRIPDPRGEWRRITVLTSSITGVAWHQNHLWAADRTNKMIHRLSLDGKSSESFKCPTETPSRMTSDGENLWLTDEGNRHIWEISPDGPSTPTRTRITPKGITWARGSLLISRMLSGPIQVFLRNPVEKQREVAAPLSSILDLAWDGRYLWCLAERNKKREVPGIPELIGYDLDRELAFTAIPLDGLQPEAVTYGDGRFYVACPDDACIWEIPAPKSGNVYFSKPREYTRLYVAGIGNETDQPIRGITVLIPEIPLEDICQEILEVKFEPPCSRLHPYEDYYRWAVIPDITVPAKSVVSIHGMVRYTRRDCQHVILPDELPSLAALPAETIRACIGSPTDDADQTVAKAARDAGKSESNPYWLMRNIHGYLIGKLTPEPIRGQKNAEILLSGRTKCGGYSSVMASLCWLNGIPCRRQGTGSAANHAWNCVYLPGLDYWIKVDVIGDDGPNALANSRLSSVSIGSGADSHPQIVKHPVRGWGGTMTVDGSEFQRSLAVVLVPVAVVPDVNTRYAVVECETTKDKNLPPACACPTIAVKKGEGLTVM